MPKVLIRRNPLQITNTQSRITCTPENISTKIWGGKCNVCAVSLHLYNTQEEHQRLRTEAINWIRTNWINPIISNEWSKELSLQLEDRQNVRNYNRDAHIFRSLYGKFIPQVPLTKVSENNYKRIFIWSPWGIMRKEILNFWNPLKSTRKRTQPKAHNGNNDCKMDTKGLQGDYVVPFIHPWKGATNHKEIFKLWHK